MSSSSSSWISSSTDLLQLALCDETRRAFEHPPHCAPHSSCCMNLFGFIRFFMEWAETLHMAHHQTSLGGEDYLHCKKLLFSAFYDMDRDDDKLVSFKDLTDYLIRQRALTSEMSQDRTFHVERAYRFDSGVRGETGLSTDTADNDGDSLPGEDDAADMPCPFDPPTVMKLLGGPRWGNSIGLVCRAKEIRFVDASMQVFDGFRCCPAVTSPVIDFDTTSHDELVVTGHQDRVLRVWSSRDARGLNRSKWRVAYQHECDAVPTAICAHRRSDRVFTGSSKGDITMWRFSNALISDYGRGDRGAFESVLSTSWAPGVFHSDTVKAINCFQRVDRIVSCALDGTASILDVPHQTKLQSFKTQRGILAMALCEEFSLLCTCGYDKDPSIWDYTTALRVPSRLIDSADPHQGPIHSVSLMTGGSTLLATCDTLAKMKMWDLRMMRCVQSLSLDRSGAQQQPMVGGSSSSSGGHHQQQRKPLANAMVQAPWGSIMVAGRKVYAVAEKRDVLPRQMSVEPAIDVTFDHQTGMILALHHDNSITTWLNGEARGPLEIHQQTRYLEKGESLRSLCAFRSRGRMAVLATSLGRLLLVNTETGTVVDACMAFDRVAVKACIIGTFEAKPFVLALARDGGIYCWKHPVLPVHTVLPPVEVTAISLGTTDGDAWIGTVNGSVYHIYLPEAVCSPPLIAPEFPNAVTSLTLMDKLGVMCLVRADCELVVYNASYQGEVLHACYPAAFSKQQPPRHTAALVARRRDGTSEGYFATADDKGTISIFRVGSKIVHPDPIVRRKQFQHTAHKSMFGGVAVSAMSTLPHWQVFVVTSEDCMGKIFDRHGVELTLLSQQHSPWPTAVLPYTTNAEQSKQVVSMIHRFFSRLRRRAAARKASMSLKSGIESRRPTLQRRQSRAMSFARAASSRNSTTTAGGLLELDELPFSSTVVVASMATQSSDDFETTIREATSFCDKDRRTPPPEPLVSPSFAAAGSSSRGLLQMASSDVTPSASPSRVGGGPLNSMGKSVRFSPKGHCIGPPPKRPSSAPPAQHSTTTQTSRIIGDSSVKKTELKKGLRAFVGQIAVVSPQRRPFPNPMLATTTTAGVNECSARRALPIAVDRVVAQQALDEKELPPSTLWAPIPRPPSPLQSRIRPRRNV